MISGPHGIFYPSNLPWFTKQIYSLVERLDHDPLDIVEATNDLHGLTKQWRALKKAQPWRDLRIYCKHISTYPSDLGEVVSEERIR